MNIQIAKMELIEMLLYTNKIDVSKKIKGVLKTNQEKLTEEGYKIIVERRSLHLKGDSKFYTWDEVKNII